MARMVHHMDQVFQHMTDDEKFMTVVHLTSIMLNRIGHEAICDVIDTAIADTMSDELVDH